MAKSHFIDIPRGYFHYHSMGTGGEDIFFCHGNSMSAGTCLPFLELMASDGFRIIAPDLRGHGFSTKEKTRGNRSWYDFVEDIKSLIEHTAKPPVIGIGHSMGGFSIYAAAAKYPELFSKIILMDPIILPRRALWGAAMARKAGMAMLHPMTKATLKKKFEFPSKQAALDHYIGKGMFRTWRSEFVAAFVEWSIEQDTTDTWTLCCEPRFEAFNYVLAPVNSWQHARKITVPTLILRGRQSDFFKESQGLRLHKKIKHSRILTLDNLGHFLIMEDPATVWESIRRFLKDFA